MDYDTTAGFEENNDYPTIPIANGPSYSAPTDNPTPKVAPVMQNKKKAPDWDTFGKAIQQAVKDFQGDAPSAEGTLPFGNQMSLPAPRAQIPSSQVASTELNPLNVAPPLQRPGDQAIQALARLYPGIAL